MSITREEWIENRWVGQQFAKFGGNGWVLKQDSPTDFANDLDALAYWKLDNAARLALALPNDEHAALFARGERVARAVLRGDK